MSEFPIMHKETRNIAYGVSDFEEIQKCNNYFVDKTPFIPLLEKNKYTFFIRPRRFGKSLWLSISLLFFWFVDFCRFQNGRAVAENPQSHRVGIDVQLSQRRMAGI